MSITPYGKQEIVRKKISRLYSINNALYIGLLINIIGSMISYKIFGRFAISNIAQILFFFLMIPFFQSMVSKKQFVFTLFFIASIIYSMAASTIYYGYSPKIFHAIFFTLCLLYVFKIYTIRRKPKPLHAMMSAYKLSVIIVLLYMSLYAAYDLSQNHRMLFYGFDDKSHAIFLGFFYSFIVFCFGQSPKHLIVSLAFFFLSLMTMSRLAVIFLPFYLFVFLKIFYQNFTGIERKTTQTKLIKYVLFLLVFLAFIFTGVYFIVHYSDAIFDVFKLLERVKSIDSVQKSGSTIAHLYLIELAISLKFENISNFIFGISPGGFSDAIASSSIDLSGLAIIDPQAYELIFEGLTPIHSVHASFFLEFSIVFFLCYLLFITSTFYLLIRRKHWIVLMFYFPFMASITFYSTHNELLFYNILVFIMIAALFPHNIIKIKNGDKPVLILNTGFNAKLCGLQPVIFHTFMKKTRLESGW